MDPLIWSFFRGVTVAFLGSFVTDGILHKNLYRTSRRRWVFHSCMFLGILARMGLGLLIWAAVRWWPTAPITQAIVDRTSPGVALAFDVLGVAVVAGAVGAMFRRYVEKDEQLLSGQQDAVAIALIGGIFVMGFVVEGARILATGLLPVASAYSFVGYLMSRLLGQVPVHWVAVYGWLWYAHAVLVVVFVAYLPFSKFLHILVGPFVAALGSGREAAKLR